MVYSLTNWYKNATIVGKQTKTMFYEKINFNCMFPCNDLGS